MRIICLKCDHANELGHVFCVECGTRLDLKNATDKIDAAHDSEARKAIWKIIWIFPVLLILALTGLGFWPAETFYNPDEKKGDAEHFERVLERTAKMIRMTDATLRPELQVEHINSWLKQYAGLLGAKTLSIKTGDNKVTLRGTARTQPRTIAGKVNIAPFTYSYDVVCRVSSNGLKISSARIGHLPLLGPAARPVVGQVEKIVSRRPREKEIYKHVIDMATTPEAFIYEIKTETAQERHDRIMRERKAAAEAAMAEREAKRKAEQGN